MPLVEVQKPAQRADHDDFIDILVREPAMKIFVCFFSGKRLVTNS